MEDRAQPVTDAASGQADEIPDAYARYIRAIFPPEVLVHAPNEIAGGWKHMTGPAEREFWRSLDARPEPQPARADEFARVKVRLCALVDSLDKTAEHGVHAEEFDQGAAHASAVTARQLRAILDETALAAAPKPAPGLAEARRALAETRERFAGLAAAQEREAEIIAPSEAAEIKRSGARRIRDLLGEEKAGA